MTKNQPTPNEPSGLAANAPQRCGLVAIVGKPNVGKSTLINAMVKQKISITSRKAQTTRHRIHGYATRPDLAAQFVLVDTPGFQTRHSNALNKTLNKTVVGALADVDVVFWVVEALRLSGADQQVLDKLPTDKPIVVVANKLDAIKDKSAMFSWLRGVQDAAGERNFIGIIPMSAKRPDDIERLLTLAAPYLPLQAWWHDADELTDRSEKFLAAEIVREKLFRLTGDELPYTSTVVIDEFKEEPRKDGTRGLVRISATIIVERESHKAMIIGGAGERLKRIGTEARQELEKLFDCKIFLQQFVKIKSGWADNEAHLKSYGYA